MNRYVFMVGLAFNQSSLYFNQLRSQITSWRGSCFHLVGDIFAFLTMDDQHIMPPANGQCSLMQTVHQTRWYYHNTNSRATHKHHFLPPGSCCIVQPTLCYLQQVCKSSGNSENACISKILPGHLVCKTSPKNSQCNSSHNLYTQHRSYSFNNPRRHVSNNQWP